MVEGQLCGQKVSHVDKENTSRFTKISTIYCTCSSRLRTQQSSSAGEFHPHALTESDVSLSTHPAPIVQPQVARPKASEQTDMVADRLHALTNISPSGVGLATSCISSLLTCAENG